eukprot:gene25720-33072_t
MTTRGDSLTARKVFIEKLLSTNPEIDPILQGSLLQGVAYHHAGLTNGDRCLIEDAYK